MASFKVDGLDGLEKFFENIAAVPDEVIDGMLNAEADVAVGAQKRTAGTMLQGPYNKGAVQGAIKKGKVKANKDGRSITVGFSGSQHGTPIGEIAFINEFGKRGQPARPFIKTANEECANEALAAATKIYSDYIEKSGG